MKINKCFFYVMLALFGSLLHAAAQNFTFASSPGVGGSPTSVTTADVNGDGWADLISANQGDSTLSVLTNDGSGNFGSNATINVGDNIATISVAAADVNGDNTPDLICANTGNNTLSVFTNDGSGNFVLASTNLVGSGPWSVTTADINGDGKVGLICANQYDNTLSILTNAGDGNFGSNATLNAGLAPVSVTVADVNGNHKLDVICANEGDGSSDGTVMVFTNDGSGNFVPASTNTVGTYPLSVTAADVNGDGKMDLISANQYDSTLSILTNAGDATFVLASAPGVGSFPTSVAAADVNGDGKVDLICANAEGTLSVLTNDGSGNFASAATLGVGSFPQSVTTADVNNDGTADLICANEGDSTLSIYLTAPNLPALNIQLSGNSVTVFWPDTWTGWTLQQNSDLTTSNWSPCDGVSDDGTNWNFTINAPSGNLFFRLSKP